jgi:hypothetical protein
MRSVLAYPRLIGLGMCMGVAYVLYQIGMFEWIDGRLHGFGYPGAFAAGLLFSYGFTTPFSIAALVAMAHEVNPFIAAPLAGIGAFLSDLVIFELLRISFFGDELERLRHASIVDRIHRMLHHDTTPEIVRRWSLWLLAAIVIASPLPDEIGVAMLSGTSKLSERAFAIICVTMNTLGILAILLLARAVQG